MNGQGSFESPSGKWHFRSEIGGPGFGLSGNSKEPPTPSTSTGIAARVDPGKNGGNPLSHPNIIPANLAPTPPLVNARLALLCVKVPVTPGKGSKSREASNEPHLFPMPDAMNDELSPLPSVVQPETPKRRGLVSLNSFQSIPLVPSFAQSQDTYPRPKANIKTSSSAFILRVENLPSSQAQTIKSLVSIANASPTSSIVNGLVKINLAFWTQHKSLLWCDVSISSYPIPTNQCRVSFTVPPTCLAINEATSTHTSIDLVLGFPTGDLIWFDPICGKYNRINKAGVVTSSPVTSLAWLPLSSPSSPNNPNQAPPFGQLQSNGEGIANQGLSFISGHADGTTYIWSTEKDDLSTAAAPSPLPNLSNTDPTELIVLPSQASDKKGGGKVNPITAWKVAKKGITDVLFSPEGDALAVTSEDGKLRVIDWSLQRIMDTYTSYFGALTTVSWSPDSRFILTGGQDDLISIFSHSEQRLLARCQGHASYVAKIAFEELATSVEGDIRNRAAPRFASVGDDGRLVLWDLSGASLHRPKHTNPYAQRRISLGSTLSLQHTLSRKRTIDSSAHLPLEEVRQYGQLHETPSMKEISALQPVSSAVISNDLLTGVALIPQGLIAVTRNGLLKVWQRPVSVETSAGSILARGRSMQ